jgi:tripartite-type tricarboxylate transporter receptor subunit TctC
MMFAIQERRSAVSVRRRSFLIGTGVMLASQCVLAQSSGEAGRLYVGFPAGGATDTAARLIAPALSAELGRTLVVENVAGASGALAIKPVERSTPEQPSFLLYPTMTMLGQVLNGQTPELDKITPISLVYEQFTVVVVNPQVPGMENVRSLNDLLALAKARPGLNYAILGVGSTGHLTMEWIASLAGVKMQYVPYKGGAPATVDLLGGHIGALVVDSTVVAPHVTSGRLRAIAVNYPTRMPGFPEIPTVHEQGFKEVSGVPWVVLVGPAGMSEADANKVSSAMARVLAKPEVAQAMRAQNVEPKSSEPAEAAKLMHEDLERWKKIIQDKGIKAS